MTRLQRRQREKLRHFLSVIREFGRSEDLREWNRAQMQLWLSLANAGVVVLDDMELFMVFGKFFYEFYEERHTIPTEEDFAAYIA